MALPPWIITPQFKELLNVTDVQEILDDFDNTIVAVSGWTEPGADLFRPPLDIDGRFFDVQFTRISALILEMAVTDDQGRSGSRTFRFDLISGSTITFFYTSKYLYIIQYADAAFLFITFLTLAPESEVAHDAYQVFGGSLVSGGGVSNVTSDRWEQITLGAYADDNGTTLVPMTDSDTGGSIMRPVSGAIKVFPIINVGDDGAEQNIRGRLYNAVMAHEDDALKGTEKPIPIGDGLTAIFKTLNFPSGTGDTTILIRKS
jgi:hypothetical protein